MSTALPIPPGMTLEEFGHRLWGVGANDAQVSLHNITRDELEKLGVDRPMLEAWRQFYCEQVVRKRGRPTSEIRLQLIERCLELLG